MLEAPPPIRPYHDDDLDAVLAVWRAASDVGHPFLDEDFLRAERLAIAREHLPASETWVYETEGRVVGFIALVGDDVGAIFVDPALHGHGVGRALMDHARALRGGPLELEVFERNTVGRAFYERYGFVLKERGVHVATGEPVLRLRLD